MGRRRRKSNSEDLVDVLFDLTDMFWQVGAVVSAVLTLASFWAADWVVDQYAKASASPLLGPLAQYLVWLYSLLPLMIAALALIFALKAYQAFQREHRF
jgi:hypothetical protein